MDFEEKGRASGRSNNWTIWQQQGIARTIVIREVSPCTFVVTCEFAVLENEGVITTFRTLSGEVFAKEMFTVPPRNPFAATNLLHTARREALEQNRLDSYHQKIKLLLHNTAFVLPARLPLFWPWSEKSFDQEAMETCMSELVTRSQDELDMLEVGEAVLKMLDDEENASEAEAPSPKRVKID